MFLYLDRAFVVSNPGTLSVFQLGLRQLRYQLEALPHVSWAGGAAGSACWPACVSRGAQRAL